MSDKDKSGSDDVDVSEEMDIREKNIDRSAAMLFELSNMLCSDDEEMGFESLVRALSFACAEADVDPHDLTDYMCELAGQMTIEFTPESDVEEPSN